MSTSPSVSVIVPVINEADNLPRLIRQLNAQQQVAIEIIVVDGGSTDGSADLAGELGACVTRSAPGRAVQLNAGAALARHDALLFLHADSTLPSETLLHHALCAWQAERQRLFTDRVAGHFKLHFARCSDAHAIAYRYLEEKTASNRSETINGDQALLISRGFFNEIGGFDESLPFMEDQRIAREIFQRGHWLLLPGTLHTSARRFETEGFHRRYMVMSLLMAVYWTGTYEFFARARDTYQTQDHTARLKVWPLLAALWATFLRDLGLRRALMQSYRIGRYAQRHSWQLFFFIDVLLRPWLGPARYPFTSFHDRIIHPLTNNVFFNGIAAILMFVWFVLILSPIFFVRDKFPRK